jgi:hypothetical protein
VSHTACSGQTILKYRTGSSDASMATDTRVFCSSRKASDPLLRCLTDACPCDREGRIRLQVAGS